MHDHAADHFASDGREDAHAVEVPGLRRLLG
jgi:hypothetical protein